MLNRDKIEKLFEETAKATREARIQHYPNAEEISEMKLPRRSWWSSLVRSWQYNKALQKTFGTPSRSPKLGWRPSYAAVVISVVVIALGIGYVLGTQQTSLRVNAFIFAQLQPDDEALHLIIDPTLANVPYKTIAFECKRPIDLKYSNGRTISSQGPTVDWPILTCSTELNIAQNTDSQ